jgi:hypothetical protein
MPVIRDKTVGKEENEIRQNCYDMKQLTIGSRDDD